MSVNINTAEGLKKLAGKAFGDTIIIDTELDKASDNPVANKPVAEAIETKYTKPESGIPKSDLSSDVQASLSKAESAIQDVNDKADKATTLAGYSISDAYTKDEVDSEISTKIAAVVAEAPAKFDTLKEIADWIDNDTTGAAKMANDIAALKTSKVDASALASASVNYANSAGSVAWDSVSGKPSSMPANGGTATLVGNFSGIGGVILENSSGFTSSFCQDIFGTTNPGFFLKEIRTQGSAPVSLLGGYASGIAWKGDDTYGSLMVSYGGPNIRVSGGNGINPVWTVDLIHSSNISSQSVNYANGAGNADTLDGYHDGSYFRGRAVVYNSNENSLWETIGSKTYCNALPDGLSNCYNYGQVISFPCESARFEIYCSHMSSVGNGLYYRSGWDNDKKPWLYFIDSSNIGSQSVNYANGAGNADTLDGYHIDSVVLKTSGGRPGVTRLYRRDNDDPYNVQTRWNNEHWVLEGYYNDDYHAGCRVARSDYANSTGYVHWNNVDGRPGSLPANGGTSDYANVVWTQSHQGTWYINSNWNGSHFVTNVREGGGSTLPIWVNNAGYADSAGYAAGAGSVHWNNIDGKPSIPSSGGAGFINTGSVIVSGSKDYTPSENAWCVYTADRCGGGIKLFIGGLQVCEVNVWGDTQIAYKNMFPVKAGQRVQATEQGSFTLYRMT